MMKDGDDDDDDGDGGCDDDDVLIMLMICNYFHKNTTPPFEILFGALGRLGPLWGTFIFSGFCFQTGAPMGTRKSPSGAQGDHLSLQGCVLKGSFSGPSFRPHLRTPNSSIFLDARHGRNVANNISKLCFFMEAVDKQK